FARSALVKPVIVNVGRAGAANLDVIQEVEYVKQESKIVYLLECLQKTPPPVLIFAENKNDVDDIHEYLLVKGVEAVAIHGGKNEREFAIRSFKEYKKDVLVASDVASKGLDFPDIQHVINYDMPKEIENYGKIGRTGRSGKTGVATTFINMNCSEQILLDLKHLLREAKQRVPPVLEALRDPLEEEYKELSG
ncbi:9644_t:CDS:2, partial [Scutellospora calospora]